MTTTEARPRTDRGWRDVRRLTTAAVLLTATYAVGILLPYYVNDLHQLPLAEVASGSHDPKDLWPQGFLGGVVGLCGLFGLGLTPLGLVFIGVGSAALALHRLMSGLRRAPTAALLTLSVACTLGIAWLLGDTSNALATWWMD